jgi:hypothetical protein
MIGVPAGGTADNDKGGAEPVDKFLAGDGKETEIPLEIVTGIQN